MKTEKIKFVDESLENLFKSLSSKDPIKKGILKSIKDIQQNAFVGRNVKKELIPSELIKKYQINNLWIYNLPDSWRLVYSLTSSKEISIIAVVLGWMTHKEYERLFKFD